MNLENFTILYVEDEFAIRKSLELFLKRKVKEIYTASDGLEGLELFRTKRPDIILTDIEMPILNGIDMAKTIKDEDNNAPIIFLSSHSDEETLKRSFNSGAESFFSKSDDYETLFIEIERLAEISHSKKEEIALKKTVEEIIESQDNMLAVLEDREIKIANLSFLEFFGFSNVQEFNKNIKSLGEITFEDIHSHSLEIENYFLKDVDSRVKLENEDKEEKYFTLFITELSSIDGKHRFLLNLNDVTKFELENRELYTLATTDLLTGLPNRLKAEELLEREIFFAKKYQHPISLIFFDIDDFKGVNDKFGTQVGDLVLMKSVNAIKEILKESELFVRWEGEKFIIVLIGKNINDTFILADNIRKLFEVTSFPVAGQITCSFGITELESDDDLDDFLSKADKALYEAKRNGKNRVERLTIG